MTADAASELPPVPLSPTRRGEWVFGVVLPGEPQREAVKPARLAGHLTIISAPEYALWKRRQEYLVRATWVARESIWYPVLASVTAVFQRPQKPRKVYAVGGVERPYPWPWSPGRVPFIGTPDADQIQKPALDVLVKAGVLVDDTLVEPIGTPRWYAAEGEEPCVEVRIWRAT